MMSIHELKVGKVEIETNKTSLSSFDHPHCCALWMILSCCSAIPQISLISRILTFLVNHEVLSSGLPEMKSCSHLFKIERKFYINWFFFYFPLKSKSGLHSNFYNFVIISTKCFSPDDRIVYFPVNRGCSKRLHWKRQRNFRRRIFEQTIVFRYKSNSKSFKPIQTS